MTDAERWTWRVWLTYYVATEEFDRTLLGAWSPRDPDAWLPFGRDALAESSGFASRERRNVSRRLDGITDQDVRRKVERMTYTQQVETLRALGGPIVDPVPTFDFRHLPPIA